MTTIENTAAAEPTTLRTARNGAVLTITIDNPPVNVLSATMMQELRDLLQRVASDSALRVIVFESAVPGYFIAHVDMHLAEQMEALQALASSAPDGVNVFQAVGEQIRRQPQVTIVKLAGMARGGGAEFVAAADMTFAARDAARLGQVESLMGILPSGGGTQYLAERVGRNRALEIVLTGDAVDAATAAAYGWVNRAIPDDQLDSFVAETAQRIGALPRGVVAAVKRVLAPVTPLEGYRREDEEWNALIGLPETAARMGALIEAGAQTVEGERDLEASLRRINAGEH